MGLACTRFASARRLRGPRQPLVRGRPRRARRARCCACRGWPGSSARRSAVLPFPIKGGRLYLYNNNPLLRSGYPGTTGSRRATRTPPAAASWPPRGAGRRLGVVLLHSPDPAHAGAAAARPRLAARAADPRGAPSRIDERWRARVPNRRAPAPTARPTTCGSPAGRRGARPRHGAGARPPAPPRPAGPRRSPPWRSTPTLLGARAGRAAGRLGHDRRHGEAAAINRRLAARRPSTASRSCSARGARCSTTPRCCPPTGRRAPPARRCCWPTSAPPRCAARTPRERAERLVELLGADGLTVHLNPCRRRSSPRARRTSTGVLEGIAAVVARLAPRPVVAKEVGFGLDPEDVAAAARARASPPSTSRAPAARTGR